MSVTPEAPQSRIEAWLATIAGMEGVEVEEPQSRIEAWLAYIAENGGGGEGEPAQYIKSASVSGNTLTLTKKGGQTVTYTPDIPLQYVKAAAVADDVLTLTLQDGTTVTYTPDYPDPLPVTHETWTFTLDDDTEVTKEVVLWTGQE